MKVSWRDVVVGLPKDPTMGAHERDGIFTVYVNDEVIFEGTRSEAFVTFIGLGKVFGPRLSKALLKLKGNPRKGITETVTEHD